MADAYFAIRDGSKRKAAPCAFMRYSDKEGFRVTIVPDVSVSDVPAFFVPFVKKGEYYINSEMSLRWVHERIPPAGRQNLGEILKAHGLAEYNELELLRSGEGFSSQDSFIVEEIDEVSFNSRTIDRTSEKRRLLGKAIKRRRESLEMTQRDLADLVGVTQPVMSNIEAGKANITFDLLADISEALSEAEGPILRLS